MNTSFKGMWDGLTALIWMVVIVTIFTPDSSGHIIFPPFNLSLSYITFPPMPPQLLKDIYAIWWVPTLILAASALWRGSAISKICAVFALLLAAGVAFVAAMGGNGGV